MTTSTTAQRLVIDRSLPAEVALHQAELRALATELIRRLSGSVWTDHNLHDPGITIAECVCYALTELAHKARLVGGDGLLDLIVASTPGATANPAAAADAIAAHFFRPEEVLPCRPLTQKDYRKLLIDIDGVRNAWIRPADLALVANLEKGMLKPLGSALGEGERLVSVRGRYDAIIEFDPTVTTEERRKAIMAEARHRLERNRNLCEEFVAVRPLATTGVSLCADLEIASDASPEEVVAKVEQAIAEHLAPSVRARPLAQCLGDPAFHELADMLDGPLLEHGVIGGEGGDDLERSSLAGEIRLSDCMAAVLAVPGVLAIRQMEMNILDGSGGGVPSASPWRLTLPPNTRPRLAADHTCVACRKRGVQLSIDRSRVDEIRHGLEGAHSAAVERGARGDAPLPTVRLGRLVGLGAPHRELRLDLPQAYGVGQSGLPRDASEERRIQALQLKGYLRFFDQVIANLAAQLRSAPRLLARNANEPATYFAERVIERDETDPLVGDDPVGLADFNATIETADGARERRHQFLDHLLARFGEDLVPHVALAAATLGEDAPDAITVKRSFLANLPSLGGERGLAFDMSAGPDATWNSNNVSGAERRIARLLGLTDHRRRSLVPPADGSTPIEGFHLVEHLLLAPTEPADPLLPICVDPDCSTCSDLDPYSYRIQIVLPAYAGRFRTIAYRSYVDAAIREELPAHLLVRICWVSAEAMSAFESAFRPWLRLACGATDLPRVATMQAMIDRMTDTKSVHPQGHLSPSTEGGIKPPFVLGHSALGTFEEETP